MTSIRSYIGHRAREISTHLSRSIQDGSFPRLALFPSHTRAVGSSNLRVFEIGYALRKLGWRTTIVPPQLELRQRQRLMKLERPDIILMQKARHHLNRPRLYPGIPVVFDIDDADFVDPAAIEGVTECCRESAAVIAGSRFVADWCRSHNPNVCTVWTCTPPPRQATVSPSKARQPIIAWAPSSAKGCCEEADLVRKVVLGVCEQERAEFYVYGVSDLRWFEDYSKPLLREHINVRAFPYMKYESFLRELQSSAVGLQPIGLATPYSHGKSFGKILAYLSCHVAVVASDAVDHPLFFRHGDNGFLARKVDEWVDSTVFLLRNPGERQRIALNAYQDFLKRLTTPEGARLVDLALRDTLSKSGTGNIVASETAAG
jgi:Glycosyl transferases group 1